MKPKKFYLYGITIFLAIILFSTAFPQEAIPDVFPETFPEGKKITTAIHNWLVVFPRTPELIKRGFGFGREGRGGVGVNLYLNPSLEVLNNNLDADDAVCVGSTLKLVNNKATGEFFTRGSLEDSPPVVFVDNLSEVIEKIKDKTYEGVKLHRFTICSGRVFLYGPKCAGSGAVICQQPCTFKADGALTSTGNNQWRVEKPGKIEINSTCGFLRCILFVDRTYTNDLHPKSLYGYLELLGISEKKFFLGKKFEINALPLSQTGPNITAKTFIGESPLFEKAFVRFELKNIGDTDARFDNISVNFGKILSMPKEIKKGETQDVLIEADLDKVQDLLLDITYEAAELGCLKQRDKSAVFNIQGKEVKRPKCATDMQCPTNYVCCANECKNTFEGFCIDTDLDGIPDKWFEGF